MSQPSARQVAIHKSQTGNLGAQVRTVDPVAGVQCLKGDIIPHPLGGWHICLVPSAFYPPSGLPAGSSNDQFHWSQGPSYSGQGVAQPNYSGTQDQVTYGIGIDGRISNSDGTYGGTVGSVTGGVSNQTSGAGNSGAGGGSSSRGF